MTLFLIALYLIFNPRISSDFYLPRFSKRTEENERGEEKDCTRMIQEIHPGRMTLIIKFFSGRDSYTDCIK